MGRRTIDIKKIENKRARDSTFKKRKSGLFKKAYELGVLTGHNTYVLIEDCNTGKLWAYLSNRMDFHPDYSNLQHADRSGPEAFDVSIKQLKQDHEKQPIGQRMPITDDIALQCVSYGQQQVDWVPQDSNPPEFNTTDLQWQQSWTDTPNNVSYFPELLFDHTKSISFYPKAELAGTVVGEEGTEDGNMVLPQVDDPLPTTGYVGSWPDEGFAYIFSQQSDGADPCL